MLKDFSCRLNHVLERQSVSAPALTPVSLLSQGGAGLHPGQRSMVLNGFWSIRSGRAPAGAQAEKCSAAPPGKDSQNVLGSSLGTRDREQWKGKLLWAL